MGPSGRGLVVVSCVVVVVFTFVAVFDVAAVLGDDLVHGRADGEVGVGCGHFAFGLVRMGAAAMEVRHLRAVVPFAVFRLVGLVVHRGIADACVDDLAVLVGVPRHAEHGGRDHREDAAHGDREDQGHRDLFAAACHGGAIWRFGDWVIWRNEGRQLACGSSLNRVAKSFRVRASCF